MVKKWDGDSKFESQCGQETNIYLSKKRNEKERTWPCYIPITAYRENFKTFCRFLILSFDGSFVHIHS